MQPERLRRFKVPESHTRVILTSAAMDACWPMCDTQQTALDHAANLFIRIWSFDEFLSPETQNRSINKNEAGA